MNRKGYIGRDTPNKQAFKSTFQDHIWSFHTSRDRNHCPVLKIINLIVDSTEISKSAQVFWIPKLWRAQAAHLKRVWFVEGSCLSFVVIRLLWDVASWKPKSSATFGNSGPPGGCLNESDFISALHHLLKHRIKNSRATKQCCQTAALETMTVWTCNYEPSDWEQKCAMNFTTLHGSDHIQLVLILLSPQKE